MMKSKTMIGFCLFQRHQTLASSDFQGLLMLSHSHTMQYKLTVTSTPTNRRKKKNFKLLLVEKLI